MMLPRYDRTLHCRCGLVAGLECNQVKLIGLLRLTETSIACADSAGPCTGAGTFQVLLSNQAPITTSLHLA